MGDPVVDEKRDAGVGHEVIGFAGGRVGGHDDCWVRVEGGRGEVGVGHEGYVGGQVIACC